MKLWLRFNEMNTRVQCFHVCVHCGGGLWSRPLYILLPTLKYPLPSDFAPPLYTSVYSLYDWTLIENMCSLFTQTFARLPFLVLYILVLLLRNPEVAFHDDRWLCRRRISAWRKKVIIWREEKREVQKVQTLHRQNDVSVQLKVPTVSPFLTVWSMISWGRSIIHFDWSHNLIPDGSGSVASNLHVKQR